MYRYDVSLIIGPHRFDYIPADHQKDLLDERDDHLEAMVWTLKTAQNCNNCPLKEEGAMFSATRKYVHVVVDAPILDEAALKKAVQFLTTYKGHTRYSLRSALGTV